MIPSITLRHPDCRATSPGGVKGVVMSQLQSAWEPANVANEEFSRNLRVAARTSIGAMTLVYTKPI